MNNKKLLGLRIKEIRKLNGLTQEKLADAIGIETCSLSAIESGRHFPSLLTLEKIANRFNIQLQAFFEFNTEITENELQDKLIKNIMEMKIKDIVCLYKITEYYKTV